MQRAARPATLIHVLSCREPPSGRPLLRADRERAEARRTRAPSAAPALAAPSAGDIAWRGMVDVDESIESAAVGASVEVAAEPSLEPEHEPKPTAAAALAVQLPWSATNVSEASKGELLAFLQGNCSTDFLRKHKLTGQAKTVKKKKKAPELQSAYKEVLDDPSVLVTTDNGVPQQSRLDKPAAGSYFGPTEPATAPNYLPESEPGCHVARFDADWLVGVEPFDEVDFGLPPGAELPDISIEPEEHLLTVINPSRTHARSVTISLSHTLRDATGHALDAGIHRDDTGTVTPCTTLVLLLAPRSLMDVCFVDVEHVEQVCLVSDIKDIAVPLPSACPPGTLSGEGRPLPVYSFPLPLVTGPYLCSQGAGGHFTHGFAETLYAVDFQCDVGTPVLAIASGTVKSIEQDRRGGGIHVTALYRWNSLMLELDDGCFAEYVHIRGNSAVVAVGDRVAQGQQLCESGDVGFCPTPHLHLQLHESADDAAPTIPFKLRSSGGQDGAVFPVAGKYYGSEDSAERCMPCGSGVSSG